jgi:hypothetical protein
MSKIKFCNLTKNLRCIRRFEVSKIYLQKSKVINSCMSACPQERGGISPRVKNKCPEQSMNGLEMEGLQEEGLEKKRLEREVLMELFEPNERNKTIKFYSALF